MHVREKLSEAQAKTLSEELSRLTRLQYEALQQWSYIKMPKEEADGYDERRTRIAEICEMLKPARTA
jgi:phosphoribosylformylglycinamidine (FGAM) synthase PurS component